MKVFISSTIFDLWDLRREIGDLIKNLGYSVLMSDDFDSDFTIEFNVNSIETCLINLKNSDIVLFILDRRYGGKLGKAGYKNISATQMEYELAIQENKKFFFYVRDKVEVEYTIFKNGKFDEMKFPWVLSKEIFEFFESHKNLKIDGHNNYYKSFNSSVDLKKAVEKDLVKINLSEVIGRKISKNELPLFSPEIIILESNIGGVKCLDVTVKMVNKSIAPAFDVLYQYRETANPGMSPLGIVSPGDSHLLKTIIPMDVAVGEHIQNVDSSYSTHDGIKVTEEWQLILNIQKGEPLYVWNSMKNINRKFMKSNPIVFEIEK